MGVRAHHPDDAVPADDNVGDELDQKHRDAHPPLHRRRSDLRGRDVDDEVVLRTHELRSREEDHPDEAELDPVVRLREVVDRYEPHEDVQKEHDKDRREEERARSLRHATEDRFEFRVHRLIPRSVERTRPRARARTRPPRP